MARTIDPSLLERLRGGRATPDDMTVAAARLAELEIRAGQLDLAAAETRLRAIASAPDQMGRDVAVLLAEYDARGVRAPVERRSTGIGSPAGVDGAVA